jgi:hypothetical protein
VIRVIFERHSHCLDFVGELVIRMLNVMTGEVQTDPRKTKHLMRSHSSIPRGWLDRLLTIDPPRLCTRRVTHSLLYIQQGAVKLTVVSPTGREAVVGMLTAVP